MTREEAQKILKLWMVSGRSADGHRGYIEGWFDKDDVEAFRMAIKALSEPKTGKWIEVEKNEYEGFSIVNMRCNQCRKYAYLVLPKGTKCVYDYCPNCGAKMKGGTE